MHLKIGELAKRTGLSVRVLHHYDKLGLLVPSVRSEAGYRLYNREDVARLHKIQVLRRLDVSLSEVGKMLAGTALDLGQTIEEQLSALDRQILQAQQLRERLQHLHLCLQADQEPSLDYWLSTLEMMSVLEKYFTDEQLALMKQNLGSKPDREMEKPCKVC